ICGVCSPRCLLDFAFFYEDRASREPVSSPDVCILDQNILVFQVSGWLSSLLLRSQVLSRSPGRGRCRLSGLGYLSTFHIRRSSLIGSTASDGACRCRPGFSLGRDRLLPSLLLDCPSLSRPRKGFYLSPARVFC